MKRIIILISLCSWGLCFAQTPRDVIRQDPNKAAGMFYVYPYRNMSPMTPAPKGYKPFYISHFGRHGARWCTSEYEALYSLFSKAAGKGLLTEAGKEFLSRYEPFYQKVRYCRGNLTNLGKDQHRKIAEHMFRRFPAVFKGPTHVEAASTESGRVIMSMYSFLSSLQALDKDLDVNADASSRFAFWLQPHLAWANPYWVKDSYKEGEAAETALKEYYRKTVPWKAITERFFTSVDALENDLKTTPEKFIEILHGVVTGTYCLDEDRGCFDDVFSEEELYQVWKGISAEYFLFAANYPGSESRIHDYIAFLLGHIIDSAESDIASGDTQLRLRFGHDSGIAPLLVLLDVNGYGRATTSFEESLEIFPNYIITMGASLQLVFYRNAAGNVLVKALVNEQEATLPLEAVSGPYYRWDDFKAHYLPIVNASRDKIMGK